MGAGNLKQKEDKYDIQTQMQIITKKEKINSMKCIEKFDVNNTSVNKNSSKNCDKERGREREKVKTTLHQERGRGRGRALSASPFEEMTGSKGLYSEKDLHDRERGKERGSEREREKEEEKGRNNDKDMDMNKGRKKGIRLESRERVRKNSINIKCTEEHVLSDLIRNININNPNNYSNERSSTQGRPRSGVRVMDTEKLSTYQPSFADVDHLVLKNQLERMKSIESGTISPSLASYVSMSRTVRTAGCTNIRKLDSHNVNFRNSIRKSHDNCDDSDNYNNNDDDNNDNYNSNNDDDHDNDNNNNNNGNDDNNDNNDVISDDRSVVPKSREDFKQFEGWASLFSPPIHLESLHSSGSKDSDEHTLQIQEIPNLEKIKENDKKISVEEREEEIEEDREDERDEEMSEKFERNQEVKVFHEIEDKIKIDQIIKSYQNFNIIESIKAMEEQEKEIGKEREKIKTFEVEKEKEKEKGKENELEIENGKEDEVQSREERKKDDEKNENINISRLLSISQKVSINERNEIIEFINNRSKYLGEISDYEDKNKVRNNKIIKNCKIEKEQSQSGFTGVSSLSSSSSPKSSKSTDRPYGFCTGSTSGITNSINLDTFLENKNIYENKYIYENKKNNENNAIENLKNNFIQNNKINDDFSHLNVQYDKYEKPLELVMNQQNKWKLSENFLKRNNVENIKNLIPDLSKKIDQLNNLLGMESKVQVPVENKPSSSSQRARR